MVQAKPASKRRGQEILGGPFLLGVLLSDDEKRWALYARGFESRDEAIAFAKANVETQYRAGRCAVVDVREVPEFSDVYGIGFENLKQVSDFIGQMDRPN